MTIIINGLEDFNLSWIVFQLECEHLFKIYNSSSSVVLACILVPFVTNV